MTFFSNAGWSHNSNEGPFYGPDVGAQTVTPHSASLVLFGLAGGSWLSMRTKRIKAFDLGVGISTCHENSDRNSVLRSRRIRAEIAGGPKNGGRKRGLGMMGLK